VAAGRPGESGQAVLSLMRRAPPVRSAARFLSSSAVTRLRLAFRNVRGDEHTSVE
jgi:hypothetical protein